MILLLLASISWIILIVLCLIPKNLRVNELVFLYMLIEIITISIFTFLDINLHWVIVSKSIKGSLSMYLARTLIIPFHYLLFISVLFSHIKAKWKGLISAAILISLCLNDQVYLWGKVMSFENWHVIYSVLMYGVFMLLLWWIAHWFKGLEKGEHQQT